MRISPKKGNFTQWYTIDQIDVIFGFFRFMNLFEVMVGILISQILRGSTPRADNAKACFDGKFSKSHVFGSFWQFFAILGVLTLNLAFLTPERHFLI